MSKQSQNNKPNHKKNNKRTSSIKKQNHMKPLIWMTAGFAAILILLAVITNIQSSREVRFTDLPSLANQPVIGDPEAPVTVYGFGDYLCPSCMDWDERIYPQLYKDYIETGKVKYAHIHVMFQGQGSQLASLAAESVLQQAPEYFWDYHQAIFAAMRTNHVSLDLLLDLAEQHVPGIDLEQLEADITNLTAMPALAEDVDLVEQYEVTKTPTVMINGIVMKNPFDYETMKRTIEKELEAAMK